MAADGVDLVIRRAIGGDAEAIAWIEAQADTTDEPIVIVMAAVLEGDADRLDRALVVAGTTRDRQVVAIAGAHLCRDRDLVDALARDHLVDHPDSYVVAWIASDAPGAR
jgi:hypothetical protein